MYFKLTYAYIYIYKSYKHKRICEYIYICIHKMNNYFLFQKKKSNKKPLKY